MAMFTRLTDKLDVDMASLLSSSSITPTIIQHEEEEENPCLMCPSCSLSFQERIGGCIFCMVLGYILSFGSFFRFRDLVLGDPRPFVFYATLGNIISLCGSCFLMGPKKQVDRMFHPTRKGATVLYLSSLGITLLVTFLGVGILGKTPTALLLIVLMICQYISIGWYCLSYIPFARRLASRFCSRIFSLDDFE